MWSMKEATEEDRLLAVVDTVMVATDEETHSKSVPVPHAAEIKSMIVSDAPEIERPTFAEFEPKPGTDEPFVWRTRIRMTDCDSFGHLNNSVYATMAEEARLIS